MWFSSYDLDVNFKLHIFTQLKWNVWKQWRNHRKTIKNLELFLEILRNCLCVFLMMSVEVLLYSSEVKGRLENTVLHTHYKLHCVKWECWCVCLCDFKRPVNLCRKCVCCGSVEISCPFSLTAEIKRLWHKCGQCWASRNQLRFYIRVYHIFYPEGSGLPKSLHQSSLIFLFILYQSLPHILPHSVSNFTSDFYLMFCLS